MADPVISAAEQAYQAFITGAEPVSDTLRRVARAFLLLSIALAKTTELQTKKVSSIADQMTKLRDYMTNMNAQIGLAGPSATDTTILTLFEGTKKDAEDFGAALLAALDIKGDPLVSAPAAPSTKYTFRLERGVITQGLKTLQLKVDDLSSLSQQEQLALQTLMNRYNAAVEATSTAIQKSGSQAEAVIRPMGTA